MGDDIGRSWEQIQGRLTLIVGSAQLGAAKAGAAYVPNALDFDPEVLGEVNPSRFAGIASDGRPLGSLLYSSVVKVRKHLGAGEGMQESLAAGGKWLAGLVRTQVADAGRGATGVAIAARPRVGYVRFVSPPACKDCAVLAGRWYRWSAGFQRHHRCDCRHLPAGEGDMPEGYRADIAPDQIHDLTQGERSALGEGADLSRVVNSQRGAAKDRMTTTAGPGPSRGARLTPDGIYAQASSREQAVDLLQRHGYLI